MASRLNPYLSFDGNARQALEFYQQVLGGTLTTNTYGEFGQGDGPLADKIMHGMLETPGGFTLMAADAPPNMPNTVGNNISLSLSGDDESDLRGYWEKLSADGQVTVPMEKQMWGDVFGMCTDKFGLVWMVNITSQ